MILRYKPSVSFMGVVLGLFQRINPATPNYFYGVPSWHASASDALLDILLRSRRAGKVLLPSYTCDRVVRAVLAASCEPVFCDVDKLGRMDIKAAEGVQNADLVAVVATHMFGASLDREHLRRFCDSKGALYIEDCAIASYEQVIESISSPIPDACVYSFGKGKPISLGFGGMGIIKQSDKFVDSEACPSGSHRELSIFKGVTAILGYTFVIWRLRVYLESRLKMLIDYKPVQKVNFDPMPLSCISPRMQLYLSNLVYNVLGKSDFKHLRKVSDLYRESLKGLGGAWSDVLEKSTVPFYPLVVEDRQSLYIYLLRNGVNVASFYTYSAGTEFTGRSYPGSERIAEGILLLPIYDGLSEEMVKKICRLMLDWQSVHDGASAC